MEYTITFTEEQMKIINTALVEGPYKIVAPVINEINRQISEKEMNQVNENISAQ